MSHFLERLTYLARRREPFADGLGEPHDEDRKPPEGRPLSLLQAWR